MARLCQTLSSNAHSQFRWAMMGLGQCDLRPVALRVKRLVIFKFAGNRWNTMNTDSLMLRSSKDSKF